jgi:fatty-acyl-CoA synthase
VAFVVLKPGATVNGAGLIQFVKQHIPEPPAQPKRIDLLDALPQTAVGKVYKPALRLQAITRVLGERLASAGLAGQVHALGLENAGGLSVEMALRGGTHRETVDAQVRAIMAPFAIRWNWTP